MASLVDKVNNFLGLLG